MGRARIRFGNPAQKGGIVLPKILVAAGERAETRFLSFFFSSASISNRNTRQAYKEAISRFFGWCEARGVALQEIDSELIAAYFAQGGFSPTTMRKHLAAIRKLFCWLEAGGVISRNVAAFLKMHNETVFHRSKMP